MDIKRLKRPNHSADTYLNGRLEGGSPELYAGYSALLAHEAFAGGDVLKINTGRSVIYRQMVAGFDIEACSKRITFLNDRAQEIRGPLRAVLNELYPDDADLLKGGMTAESALSHPYTRALLGMDTPEDAKAKRSAVGFAIIDEVGGVWPNARNADHDLKKSLQADPSMISVLYREGYLHLKRAYEALEEGVAACPLEDIAMQCLIGSSEDDRSDALGSKYKRFSLLVRYPEFKFSFGPMPARSAGEATFRKTVDTAPEIGALTARDQEAYSSHLRHLLGHVEPEQDPSL